MEFHKNFYGRKQQKHKPQKIKFCESFNFLALLSPETFLLLKLSGTLQ